MNVKVYIFWSLGWRFYKNYHYQEGFMLGFHFFFTHSISHSNDYNMISVFILVCKLYNKKQQNNKNRKDKNLYSWDVKKCAKIEYEVCWKYYSNYLSSLESGVYRQCSISSHLFQKNLSCCVKMVKMYNNRKLKK